jgi:sugar lactone lactonase YvrE
MTGLDRDLSAALHREVAGLSVDAAGAVARFPDRLRARRRQRRGTALGATAAIVALVAAIGLFGGGQPDADAPPADDGGRVETVEPRGSTRVALGSAPSRVTADGDTVWVALATGSLARVDAATDHVDRVGELPSIPFDVQPAGGLLWVSLPNDNRVVALDPTDGRLVHSVPTTAPGPRGLTSAGSSIWATAGTRLLQIDARTGETTRTVAVPGGVLPYDVSVSADAAWVTDSRARTVTRVPLDGGAPTSFDVGGPTVGTVVSGGAVWVGLKDAPALLRLDPDSGATLSRVRLPATPLGLAVVAGDVWATAPDADRVLSFDGASGRRTRDWKVGDFPPIVAGDDKTVWVSSNASNELVKVPLATNGP